MSRKPAHLEMSGGKSPRQRAWEAMRASRGGFDQEYVARRGNVSESIVKDYVRALLNGGYIEIHAEERINALCVKRTYRMVRDSGVEAPRLTKKGVEVPHGCVNEAMWGTLRRMFKSEAVDYRQLAAFASTASRPISEATAKAYVLSLAMAGYLECVQQAIRGGKAMPARYRLLPSMDSGRRAPMIQRTKVVFDPNWNKVVWTEQAEVADE